MLGAPDKNEGAPSRNHDESGPAVSAEEVELHASTPMRLLLWMLGTIFLGLGTLGIFLPILPTTPFVLLAAACYARSSRRFYFWLLSNRVFGPLIRNWRETRSVPRRAKIIAVSLITLTIGYSVIFVIPIFQVKVLVAVVGLAVIIFLLRLPTSSAPS